MLENGIPMIEAMQIARGSAGSVLLEEALEAATEAVEGGDSLAPPLEASGMIDEDVLEMISVGESTGAMDVMLTKIADFYEEEVEAAVGALTSLLEPLMMVFLGGVVGGLMIAMYMPIFSMAGNVKAG